MTIGDVAAVLVGIAAISAAIAIASSALSARRFFFALSALLVVASVVLGVGYFTGMLRENSVPDRGPSTAPTPSDVPAPGPPTGFTAEPASEYAVVELAAGQPGRAALYFGRLAAVVDVLGADLRLVVDPSLLHNSPDLCVSTVVVAGVPATTGTVHAEGLGQGWGAAEDTPDEQVAGPTDALHQQLVVPPPGSGPGRSWQARAVVLADGYETTTGEYTLELIDVSGETQTWQVGFETVTCTTG